MTPMKGSNNRTLNPVQFLKGLDRDIQTAETKRDELDRFITGLYAARASMSDIVLSDAIEQNVDNTGSRTDEIKEILDSSNEPLSMDEIMEELARRGRTDQRSHVSATMSHLAKKNYARKVSRGTWESAHVKVARIA